MLSPYLPSHRFDFRSPVFIRERVFHVEHRWRAAAACPYATISCETTLTSLPIEASSHHLSASFNSNNPFRNRGVSPNPAPRPVSRNPFLDDSVFDKDDEPKQRMVSQPAKMVGNAATLFVRHHKHFSQAAEQRPSTNCLRRSSPLTIRRRAQVHLPDL